MARRKDVRACDPYRGVTIEQAKAYWDRKGYGHAARQRAKRGAKWQQLGTRVYMTDRFGDKTMFVCSNSRIVGYAR